jgi:hypothetical protein
MKNPVTWILSLCLILAPAAHAGEAGAADAPQRAADADDPAPPATYDVFIDGVTGYAFVKTPFGWKFVRKIGGEPQAEPAASRR